MVSAEISPLAQAGGLGEVIGSLSSSLIDLGHDVRVVLPYYEFIDSKTFEKSYFVDINGEESTSGEKISAVLTYVRNKVPVYLIKKNDHFAGTEIYGKNELSKFLCFSKCVIALLKSIAWRPNIVHCHDWHTALVPMWIKKTNMPFKSIFTIHNLAYQGWFDDNFLVKYGLIKYYPHSIPRNFIVQGILNADYITTVSKNYAREILTSEYGEGLELILEKKKERLSGIINGIDYEIYDPATDKYIKQNYDYSSISKKVINKIQLQAELGLHVRDDIPLIGFVQRLEEQKGLDILLPALDNILNKAQFIVLGKGKHVYERALESKECQFEGSLKVCIGFDNALAHLIYAGCDLYVMPSRFEPCGLGQLIAMRYGSVPVVRSTGGLADSVIPFNDDLTEGNGFVFNHYSSESLILELNRAISFFYKRALWQEAIRRIMRLDYSWRTPAKEYEKLYSMLIHS